ncbi:MAG: LamG domain-containing protein [Armatimonadetes bacterium]|nr:LamG domain-containing protein [Armatimonadota bacterium]
MRCALLSILMAFTVCSATGQPAPGPFTPDAHTVLLYHFDESAGTTAHDASGHGQHGILQGPEWTKGRFGGALWFDGVDDCVFLADPHAIQGLKQITVECWFNQEETSGRRFLVGHDVAFHFEVDDGMGTSISLYNHGGGVPNAEGKAHQQVFLMGRPIRAGRWHHLAITYDGQMVSHFLDGVLRGRLPGPRDFSLGAMSRGLWVGCYVGTDFWFSGLIDEVRVSDCVRYDPESKLQPGGKVFEMPPTGTPLRPSPTIRAAERTGAASLFLQLQSLYGGPSQGWICFKPPGKPASVVGRFEVKPENGPTTVEVDVSDEYAGDGTYLVGLVPEGGGYFALTSARLVAGGLEVARWSGEARSRRTFSPPILAPLSVGPQRPPRPGGRLLFLPAEVDWARGNLELDTSEEDQPPLMIGEGQAEWWFYLPTEQIYRVYMRYASASLHPCDTVIDGNDLNEYDMCAVNRTGRETARDAFWEYQGSVHLTAGAHWLRVQDMPPAIVALRFEPTPALPPRKVAWGRYPVPSPEALSTCGPWKAKTEFGKATGVAAEINAEAGPGIEFRARFANDDPEDVWGGDCVRFGCPVKWDLEPYGRLRFVFRGQGSGHVIALWLLDAKGDEKLIWRHRDTRQGDLEVRVPLNFEGNDVFDPGRIVAVSVDLDEGNVNGGQGSASQGKDMRVALINPVFYRRDTLAEPEGYRERLTGALKAVQVHLKRLGDRAITLVSPGFRPWTRPVVPEEHPLYAAAEPKPVTRAILGFDLHFTGARSIDEQTLKNFHDYYDFGDVCWPHIGILPQRRDFGSDEDYQAALRHLEERLKDVQRRGLIVWDIFGYVPHNEAGPTPRVAPEHHEILLRVLGERFLGYDNGEQDGRYIGSYADRDPITNRREGWEYFVRWDEGICRDSMNYMNATGSLNFSHYYGERGCRTLGLETAQGLPSDTLMFAFLRGAAKQYGRLTTQATSIWNRFGYNMYHDRRTEGPNGYGFGPNKGCSLSLHRRLFFQSYTGGDSIVGTETAQFTADVLENGAPELSPLGRQHLELREWVRRHPDRGVMYTPVAFMLDFYNGWNPPRHLYRSDKYKIWGKLPYEKGDYLIDAVFRMVWPGYEDCSYLRNERGFITPTPYGDIFDVITNRCHAEVLKQYTAIMLLGDVELDSGAADRLMEFVRQGGDLLLDAGNARQLPVESIGLRLGQKSTACTTARVGTEQVWAEQPYVYTEADLDGATAILINEHGKPVLTVNEVGKGRVIVCLAEYWMTDALKYANPEIVNMEPPYRLLEGVSTVLGEYFASFSPVIVEPAGLNVRVNCYADNPRRLLVALTNNDLFADWQGTVRLRDGTVTAVRDLRRERDLRPGKSVPVTVPSGDVVLLDVTTK